MAVPSVFAVYADRTSTISILSDDGGPLSDRIHLYCPTAACFLMPQNVAYAATAKVVTLTGRGDFRMSGGNSYPSIVDVTVHQTPDGKGTVLLTAYLDVDGARGRLLWSSRVPVPLMECNIVWE